MEIGLYVHIPFCYKKCSYCDFLSFPINYDQISAYTEALIKEIKAYGERIKNKHTIKTIFIGGGTPTVLSPLLLSNLCEAIMLCFDVTENVEWTIEVNPGTLSKDLLKVLKRYPVNRVSLGLQAVQENLLKKLGRIHTFEEWKRSISLLWENDIININTDIMFSLPGQTMNDLKETLKTVTGFGIKHISAYSLIIEEGTPFEKLYQQGELTLPDEEEDRKMYHFIQSFLASEGYGQYEISNWAKDNQYCRHNILYWEREPYIGTGLGAHSFFENIRFSNVTTLKDYINAQGNLDLLQQNKEFITDNEAIEEYMFLGLRLTRGISLQGFKEKFRRDLFSVYKEEIDQWIKMGALVQEGDRIRLSNYGIDISNQVFASFLQ